MNISPNTKAEEVDDDNLSVPCDASSQATSSQSVEDGNNDIKGV